MPRAAVLAYPSEHQEQAALVRWATLYSNDYPALALLFAIPNGGARDAVTGARLKAEGVRAGVPDMYLPVARDGWHGLFIELKVGRNKPSKHQEWWSEKLTEQGYLAVVCWGWHDAAGLLVDYLGLPPECKP